MNPFSLAIQLILLVVLLLLSGPMPAQPTQTDGADTLHFDVPGFTKIKKGAAIRIFDEEGNEYRYASDLAQLQPEVTALDLRRKGLPAIPPEVWDHPQLKILLLSQNQLTSLPTEVAKLKDLQKLDLALNQLTSLPAELENLQQLQALHISSNRFETLPPVIFKLTNLQWLSAVSNKTTALPADIGNLQELRRLDLGFNKFRQLPAEIGNLDYLERLNLDFNSLNALPPEMGKLTNLQQFSASINSLTTLPKEIGYLESLQILRLNSNDLTEVPAEIGWLENLRELDLSQNQLKTLPDELLNLSNLKELDLHGNSFPLEFSERLVDALPDCKISYDGEREILEKKLEETFAKSDKFPIAARLADVLRQQFEADTTDNILKFDLVNAYGNASYFALFDRKPEAAIQWAEKGLAMYFEHPPVKEWINSNLALGQLYSGEWEKAKAIYEAYVDKTANDGTPYREIFLQDLDDLAAYKISHPDVTKARELLKK